MRQIILDTETTGLDSTQGHKIIEIGAIEMINRSITGNHFHHYINPERKIDQAAIEVHGITSDQLEDKPIFLDLSQELLNFLNGAEVIIHNAPFDVAFLNYEFQQAGMGNQVMNHCCKILDTLIMARHKHPGKKNNLNVLSNRYGINNTHRKFHGALTDANILAKVYLEMTKGQMSMLDESDDYIPKLKPREQDILIKHHKNIRTPLVRANSEELSRHYRYLKLLEQGRISGSHLESNQKKTE